MARGTPIADLVELFEQSAQKHARREMFGRKRGGRWVFVTYAQVKKEVDEFRAGLASIGIAAGDRVAIVANNRVEWAVAAYAAFGLGASLVPMYESQTAKDWEFIARDSGAKALIVSSVEIWEQTRGLRDELASLRHLVLLEGDGGTVTYEELLRVGVANPVPVRRPAPDAEALLIYTSGTTGAPKGVILSHGNIASNVVAISESFDIRETDRSLSFLPWAHGFGCTCELQVLVHHGASLALCDSVEKIVEDLADVRPTILIAVPRIFNRVYSKVTEQMNGAPAPVRALFSRGLRAATKRRSHEPLDPLETAAFFVADRLIFSKIRARLGGRVRYAISGAAALATEVAEFIYALGIDVYEGYGLTEASPIISANTPGARRVGSVGRPIRGVRVEVHKGSSDDPRFGEIVVYGPNVMQGYHARPAETAAALTHNGGFRTGDMGYVDQDGFLFIAGRIKEQYKLENGKYVIPSPLEEKLKLSPLIGNVMIHGANMPFNVALVVPDRAALSRLAASEGVADGPGVDWLADERIVRRVREEIDRCSADFKGYEKVHKFILVPDDFTQQNGLLTPSLKLKRARVAERWSKEIGQMYA